MMDYEYSVKQRCIDLGLGVKNNGAERKLMRNGDC